MRLRAPHPEGGIRQRLLRRLQRGTGSRRPERRDDRGLTTLEWLLVVAAIAGLAALAVVLVSTVVSDTADQVGNLSPRLAAARLQAHDIEVEASQLTLADIPDRATYNAALRKYEQECTRLGILYRDIDGFIVKFYKPPAPAWGEAGDSDQLKQDILKMNVEIGIQMGFGGDPPQSGCWMAVKGKRFTVCCTTFRTDLRDALIQECTRLNIGYRDRDLNLPATPRTRCQITLSW